VHHFANPEQDHASTRAGRVGPGSGCCVQVHLPCKPQLALASAEKGKDNEAILFFPSLRSTQLDFSHYWKQIRETGLRERGERRKDTNKKRWDVVESARAIDKSWRMKRRTTREPPTTIRSNWWFQYGLLERIIRGAEEKSV
jgi:hypothetical protein